MMQNSYNNVPEDYKERKAGVAYGEIQAIRYFSTTVGKDRDVIIALPPN